MGNINYLKLGNDAMLYAEIHSMFPSVGSQLTNCYSKLADAILGDTGMGIVSANADTYNFILSRHLITYMTYAYASGMLNSYIPNESRIGEILDTRSNYYITKILPKISDVHPVEPIEYSTQLPQRLAIFGISSVDNIDDINDADFITDEDIARLSQLEEIDFQFDDKELEELDLGETEIGDTPQGESGDESEDIEIDPDEEIELDETPQNPAESASNPEANVAATHQDEEADDEELIEAYESKWGGLLENTMSSVLKRFEALYKSGFSGIISEPWGLLTDIGVIKAYSSENLITRRNNSDDAVDINMYQNIMTAIASSADIKFNGFRGVGKNKPATITDKNGNVKPYNELMDDSDLTLSQLQNPTTEVLYNLHTKICFGYFRTCKGLRKYAKSVEKGDPSYLDKATKVKSWKTLKGYLMSEIKRTAYQIYKNEGIGSDAQNMEFRTRVNNVNELLKLALCNAIVIPERVNKVYTEVRISVTFDFDVDTFIRNLSNSLGQKVELIEKVDGVVCIRVVYDDEKTNSTTLFAKDTLDGILSTGEPIRWDHALLGKDRSGKPFFWNNFKEDAPSKRVYCIYAESRAGKGIMTSTLLCNALSNGYKLMYIDGKPENGAGTGMLAWQTGKEAAVYNGFDKRAAPFNQSLEAYTYGLRDISMATASKTKIPAKLFKTAGEMQNFINTCTYLRGIEAAMRLIDYRSTQNMSPDDWFIVVFDEIRQLADCERKIRSRFNEVMASKELKISKDAGYYIETEKNKDKFDEQAKFINSWYIWLNDLASYVNSAMTMSIGKSNSNAFFIFQGSDWFETYSNTFIVGKLLKVLDSTKIIGRQGVSGKGGDTKYGNGNAANYSWVQYINNHAGSWAITHSASVGGCQKEESVDIFKPFNVFLRPQIKPEKADGSFKSNDEMEAEIAAILNRPDSQDPDGERYKYIGPYINKMIGAVRPGSSADQILNEAYVYINNFIVDQGLGESLNEFMYNAHDFGLVAASDNMDPTQQLNGNEHLYDAPTPGGNGVVPGTGTSQGRQMQGNVQGAGNTQNPRTDSTKQMDADSYGAMDAKRYMDALGLGIGDEGDFEIPGFGGDASGDEDQILIDNAHNPQGTIEDNQSNQGGAAPRQDVVAEPEVMNTNRQSPYQKGTYEDRWLTFITPSEKSRFMKLNAENSTIVLATDHRSMSKSAKLLRSVRGAQYEFKSRWECILNAVANSQSPNSIARVTIHNDLLLFNNKQIACMGLLGGEDGIMVEDIVNFEMLAKRFKNIRTLEIDTDIYEASTAELGDSVEISLFNLFKNLNALHLRVPGQQDPKVITRRELNSQATQAAIREQNERTKLKHGIDTIAAAKNPHLKSAEPIVLHRVTRNSANLTSGAWKTCKSQMSKGNYIRGGLAGAGTLVMLGVTAPLAILSKVFKGNRR